MIDPLVRKNRWLAAAGLSELVYGLLEIGDTLYLLLLQAHWVPNLYPSWSFDEVGELMNSQPIVLFPVFAFFSLGRIAAAIGVLRNRLWGFWLTLFLSIITALWAYFFLPLGGLDMLGCLFIVGALLAGRLGRTPIAS